MDALKSYRDSLPSYQRRDQSAIVVPPSLRPFPLYISALLKCDAFRFKNIVKTNYTKQNLKLIGRKQWRPICGPI